MTAPPVPELQLEDESPVRPEAILPAERRGWLAGWLTTREAAAELGLSSSRIRQFYLECMCGPNPPHQHDGAYCSYCGCKRFERRLPGTKRGRDLLFRLRDLNRLRERRNGRPPGEAWRGRAATARRRSRVAA